MTNTSLKI